MALTNTAIKNAKTATKSVKLFDERRLFVIVTPAGGKWWRLKYRFDNKEKLLSLGVFPDISLKTARERRDELRALIANCIDPGLHRKVMAAARTERAGNSFEVIAREWFAKHSLNWAPSHADKIIKRLERDVFPWLGGRPIAEITAQEILASLRRIEARGAVETAHRAQQNCGQVFRYAVVTGRASRDPCADLNARSPRSDRRILRPSPIPLPSVNCYARSTAFAAPSSCNVPCVSRRYSSCVPASHAKQNGRTSISIKPSGATSRPKPKPSTLCHWQTKPLRFLANFTR